MARGWRVLDATSFDGVVSGARGRITLSASDGHVQEVPAEEAAVLLIGQQTALTAVALHYLSKHDIVLLAADWRGIPHAGLYPWSNHGRVAARHIAQADLSLPRKKNAWMQLIRAKVAGQAANLSSIDPFGAEHLADLSRHVRSGDPSNVEGAAARFYWSRLFAEPDHFVRDHGAVDPLNAMLNYGYMVLRGHGVRAVLAAGLSPPLGLFHRGRSNYFNLVDDLIEPFRPAVEASVIELGSMATLADQRVKRALVTAASQPFAPDGRRIPTVLEDLAQQLGRYVEGEVDRLSVEPWSGPRADRDAELTSALGPNEEPPW